MEVAEAEHLMTNAFHLISNNPINFIDCRKNSSNSWQAMIHEDLLLSHIDILENKLLCCQRNITDEKLQAEVNKLQDEKTNYQVSNRDSILTELFRFIDSLTREVNRIYKI